MANAARTTLLGWICAASGVLMLLVGVLTRPQASAVPITQWSFPQQAAPFLITSLILAVAHAMSACGYLGALSFSSSRIARSRAARGGLITAAVGSLLLSASEVASGLIGGLDVTSVAAGAVGTVFGVASLVLAVGAIVAGVALVRRRVTAAGWLVLLTGVTLLVLVTPANASGDPLFRLVALAVWSVLYIPLGLAVARAGKRVAEPIRL